MSNSLDSDQSRHFVMAHGYDELGSGSECVPYTVNMCKRPLSLRPKIGFKTI